MGRGVSLSFNHQKTRLESIRNNINLLIDDSFAAYLYKK